MKRALSFAFAAAVALAGALWAPPLHNGTRPVVPLDVPLLGSGSVVQSAFTRWTAQYEREGGERRFEVSLGWSKALSSRHTTAHGTARIDLVGGSIEVEATALPSDTGDVWLVDNQPLAGDSVRPEPHDRYRYVGRLVPRLGNARLTAELGPTAFRNFDVDVVVIARNDVPPAADGGLLFGSPTLFQRLHRRQQQGPVEMPDLFAEPGDEAPEVRTSPFEALSLPVALAHHDEPPLIANGRELFFNGTFGGNGRTCGTCHPASNNLTLDPPFIASLPATDPLFVAQRVPALAGLENPALMRAAGLILENLDGFDRPGVMRSVPHTFAMPTSIAASTADGSTVPPRQRTGWGGDGAPGGGTLRDFSTGAVTQHFPRTLARRPGVDFRLPTDAELDAMEAFMLSLGRQTDLNLTALTFQSDVVDRGRQIFNNDVGTDVAQGRCFRCHENGGANLPGGAGNGNFDTGIANLLLTTLGAPRDAGFGGQTNPAGGFGDGKFNTPPLVEAADTPPFFHNNTADTIEAAVTFYTTDTFARSPSGQFLGAIRLSATDIAAVAAFLRVLNALENIRQALEQDDRSLSANNIHRARIHIQQAIEETNDAADVLRGAGLHSTAVLRLSEATTLLTQAFGDPNKNRREPLVVQAKAKKAEARANILR